MCGRLVLTSNYKEKIKAIFSGIEADTWLPPRYNITPAQLLPSVLDADPLRLQWLNWGFAAHQPNRPPPHQCPRRNRASAADFPGRFSIAPLSGVRRRLL